MSLKRHQVAREQLEAKLALACRVETKQRQFQSNAMPNFEEKAPCIMPSDKPSTVAIKPSFASDKLPKKEKKVSPPKSTGSAKDFIF